MTSNLTGLPRLAALAVIAACAAPAPRATSATPPAKPPTWIADTSTYRGPAAPTLAQPYAETAAKIIAAARANRAAYDKLAELTDTIGARLAGSPQLDQAIAWALAKLRADGHDARSEAVMVPHWVRGAESAAIVAPVARPLRVLGLGGTVATPKGGVTARLVVVRSWDELERTDVKGAIVLFDVALPAWDAAKGSGYGEVAPYRGRGPSRAAKQGAVGVLMRSVTHRSLSTPHTGALSYDPAQPKIPAAAVTVEDAQLLGRLAAKGPVRVTLSLASQLRPDARSANVIGELRGRDKPDEVVVIGAHLDSWDVGQGAHDDGAGVVIMMQALTVLRELGLQPRRTIRVVLFTNEENGLRGGRQYAQDHAAELPNTVLAIESDSGGFAPRGFSVDAGDAGPRVIARVRELLPLFAPLGALEVKAGYGGADIGPMVPAGVPTMGLDVYNEAYFDIHHTEADTLDKVDPAQLADCVATMAVIAYVAADLPGRLDAP